MSLPPAVQRIRAAWQAREGFAVEQALLALFVATLLGGAHLARLGTPPARIATALVLLVVAGLRVGAAVRRRQNARSAARTVAQVLGATDPALAERAGRALATWERARLDETVGSAELAELHFTRVASRATDAAIGSAASKHAQRYRGAAVALLGVAITLALLGPARIVEGLDVLVARNGRAPLPIPWLGYPRISAQPPAYTREGERALVFGVDASLPKGTVLTVRGVPLAQDRALVLTDGVREEPFTSDGAGAVVARLTVRADAVVRVTARFGDVRIDDEESLAVTVLPDDSPAVELEEAPRTLKLADLERLDVRWVARDDHGLREVDLVLRAGAREERRVLARFDGESRVERGGTVLLARDSFLRRMFLPISVAVEAKDNDPFDGPKWGKSAVVTILPPDVGQPEAERYAAVTKVRDELVDLLKYRDLIGEEPPQERSRLLRERYNAVSRRIGELVDGTYSGATIPSGLRAFVSGQLDRLGRESTPDERVVEGAILAVDAALSSLGNRDAAEVAKRLADVAEEAAVSARAARDDQRHDEQHRDESLARLGVALVALDRGVARLRILAALGQDLGGVALGDAGRVRRARDAGDLTHAELAALHLAERLRRPSPSFGATTGGRSSGGVESGRPPSGRGGEGESPSASSADSEFDEAASAVRKLAAEHEGAMRDVSSAMQEAARHEPTSEQRAKAKQLADRLREAVQDLPLPGQEFGTPRAGAALGREHARAAATALDDVSLEQAKESAESARAALDQAERRLDPEDPLRDQLGPARRALDEALSWMKGELDREHEEASRRARAALEQAADVENELSKQAERLVDRSMGKEGAMPRDVAEGLERASSVMQEAARKLAEGRGEDGAALQREAQRLLDRSRMKGTSSEGDEDSDERAEDDAREASRRSRSRGGKGLAIDGDVPAPDDAARAEEFRRRVLEGLSRERSERLGPAIKRYAEELLR